MRVLIIFLLLISGSAYVHAQGPKPIILGETHELQSVQLSEKRTLNIYLPESYSRTDTTISYPVIYLLDGGLDEDFIHVVGLVQFNSFSWINRVPESIVVGITNTDRKRDMTYPTTVKGDKQKYPTTGGSEKFIAFIEKEVIPYVSKFRTNKSKTIIGESLGGLLVTEILFTKPGLFDKYIIISPSIWWDNGSLLKKPIKTQAQSKTDIYIAVGKEGLTPGEEPRVMEVDANLLYDKIQSFQNKNIKVYFDYLPEETHATIAHQAVFNAFKKLYPTAGK
ncbi:MAG: alpha/beta hydrolase [Flavipsychrobacter sp.]|jgi:predicted alpha/beta superfamily hydrolase|nr:alpha/beta hydrolase [Flavipsychrobacter sp.]